MGKFIDYIKSKPNFVLSMPAILCFVQFTTNFFWAVRTNDFDNNTINTLLASADGFETVVIVAVMFVLKGGKTTPE